jgi:GT2 family glycosyltransferase
MENNQKIAIVGAKIIPAGHNKMWWNAGWDSNHFRQSAGYFIGFLLKIFPQSQFLKNFSMKFILNYWDYDKTLKVDWVVEGCFCMRKSVFDKIGGFDEKFFMGHENPDLCLRARNVGCDVYFYPEAEAEDLVSHTHNPIKRRWWLNKGNYYFYKKHYFYKKSNPVLFGLGRIISGISYLLFA